MFSDYCSEQRILIFIWETCYFCKRKENAFAIAHKSTKEKIQVHTRIDYWYVIAEQHAVRQLHHRNCKQDANTKAR